MFLSFESQDERKKAGSGLIELQYARLPRSTPQETLVSLCNIERWKDDSLYIRDENAFYQAYHRIFVNGIYGNLRSGVMDLYGINYYSPAETGRIIERVLEEKPVDFERLAEWLKKANAQNGFYLLGI